MRTHIFLALGIAVTLLMGNVPGVAAPGAWKTAKPEAINAKPSAGKTLKTFPSPNGRYSLIYRDEKEQGDFVWRHVYLKHGTSHTLIDTYNEIKNVRWINGSRTVQFRAMQAIGPDKLQHIDVKYTPATRRLRWRSVRVEKVQSSL